MMWDCKNKDAFHRFSIKAETLVGNHICWKHRRTLSQKLHKPLQLVLDHMVILDSNKKGRYDYSDFLSLFNGAVNRLSNSWMRSTNLERWVSEELRILLQRKKMRVMLVSKPTVSIAYLKTFMELYSKNCFYLKY